MSETERSNNSEKEIVAVTKHGQATIPHSFGG
jgi:bifunctional DNA-binding transcriptional regulator/antitoxin component of YhaV-PrlF toxin-antitoxin module